MLIDNSHHHHHHHNHHHNHRYYQQQQHQQQQQQTQQQQSLTMNNEQKDVNNNDCNRKRLNVNSHHHSYHRQQQQQTNQLSPAMMTMTNTTNENMVRNHHHQQSVFRSQTLPCRKLNININNMTCDSQYRNRNRCSFNENHHHNQQFNCQSTRQQQQQQSMCNVNDQNNNMSKSSSTVTTTTNQTSSEQQQQCSINATMTIRRLLQLYEMGEYHEAANIISRLPYQTFRSVVLDLPVDIFVEAIPSSLPILDALYAKIFFSGRDLLAFGFKFLHPENVVSNMIKMFAICDVYSHPTSEESISICKKLLKVILIADPSLRKQLLVKKALIDRAVEGMGHHGLVGTSNDALMNLHEALRLEFERVIQQYKGAIAKIDELSSTNKIGKDGGPITRSLSQGPAPTFSSHQRLLSLKQEEIQDRLNKNRSLLCALEPCFRTNHSLQILLAILQKRIDYDKETLFQFGQLSREYSSSNSSSSSSTTNNNSASSSSAMSSSISSSSASGSSLSPSNTNNNQHNSTNRNHKAYSSSSSSTILSNQFERDSVVAPVLMRFSHGCNQVLNLLKEIQNENGTIENDENTNEQQQQQQQQILLKSQCPTTTNTGGSSNGNCNNNNEIVKNQSTIIESQTSTTSSCIASTTTSTLMTTAASTKTANNHQLNHGNNRLNNQQQICLNDYLNKTTLVDVHQQSPVNISQSTTATTATTTTNDDSSDISGYHSDSDMSPISLQSPLASNNNRLPNNIQSSSNRMSTNKDNTNNKSNHHFSQQQHSSFSSANNTFNHQSNLKSEPDIAIMTGNSDSTTILDGQVTINSGDSENSNNDNQQNICCSSINNDDLNDDINTDNSDNIGTNSICRIEIDGKTMLKNDNFNHDENEFKLKLELLNARKRIDELEKQNSKFERRFSSSSLLLQSNYLNFDLPNQPNNNHINNLLQHYDYLYSQVRTDVIDALNQFDELKDSNELKIKLIFSIIVLAHRSAEQTFKDLYLNLRKLLKFDLNSDGDCIKNNDNNNDIDDDDCHRLLPIKIYYEQIETSIRNYLCITSAYFDIEPNVQNVCQQIWDTLYDYPCLERCTKLIDFIRQCVRFCWSLIVQHSDIKFDIETKNFRNDWHIRTVDSYVSNTLIKCYLWPTLFQHDICVHKGIVIT